MSVNGIRKFQKGNCMKDTRFIPVLQAMHAALPRFVKKPQHYLHYLCLLSNSRLLSLAQMEACIDDFDARARKRVSLFSVMENPLPGQQDLTDLLILKLENNPAVKKKLARMLQAKGRDADCIYKDQISWSAYLASMLTAVLFIYVYTTRDTDSNGPLTTRILQRILKSDCQPFLAFYIRRVIIPVLEGTIAPDADALYAAMTQASGQLGLELSHAYFDDSHKLDFSWLEAIPQDPAIVQAMEDDYVETMTELIDTKAFVKNPDLKHKLVHVFNALPDKK